MSREYTQGRGVVKNYEMSFVLATISATNGNEGGKTLAKICTGMLSPEELANAEKLVLDYMEKRESLRDITNQYFK